MDVAVFGSLNIDLSCYCNKFPNVGETIYGTKFAQGFGGKGANQCVAAQKLGAHTSIVSRVGKDSFGKDYLKHLKELGVETSTVKISETSSTGVAIITVEQTHGNNEIIIIPGANEEISADDFDEAMKSGKISKKVLLCQFETNAAATVHAMEKAKAEGLFTILDPAPAPVVGSPFRPLLKRLLAASTIACPNETEAAVLTGINYLTSEAMTPDEIVQSAIPWLSSLQKSGVTYPMVTLGVNGCICLLPKSEGASIDVKDVRTLKLSGISDKEAIFHIRGPIQKQALDTTGAGDCFAGSLAFFISKYPKLCLVEKIRRSVWIASQSVLELGTQTSFLERAKLPQALFDEDGQFEWPTK